VSPGEHTGHERLEKRPVDDDRAEELFDDGLGALVSVSNVHIRVRAPTSNTLSTPANADPERLLATDDKGYTLLSYNLGMVRVSETIFIDRPLEAVYEYLDHPENHAEVTPSLAEATPIEQLANGGKRAQYTYRMAGISREGHLTETTHNDGERMIFEMSGELTGEIDISFAATDGGTEVTYAAEYDLPGRVVAAVAKPFAKRYNKHELATTLDNLKTRLETAAATPSAETETQTGSPAE
jgi:Polyketide cyclase / dehydrase and lipid transport.